MPDMERCTLIVCLCCVFLVNAQDSKDSWLKRFIPRNYSKNTPPVGLTGPSVVTCYVAPIVVTNMLMKEMEFVVDTVLIVSWFDHRLKMPENQDVSDSDYALPKPYAGRVWVPYLIFFNSKGRDARLIGPDTAIFLTHGLTADQPLHLRIYYRESFHFLCRFVFHAYPFDKQECQIMMLSGAKQHQKIINFFPGWTFKNITVPPEFRLQSFARQNCVDGSYDKNRFTCLRFVFVFYRIYTHQMMTIFVPSILIVTLSWISFWIEVSAPAPRVTLGLTSLLTLATQFNSAQKDLPSVADVKAIDIWMFACMFMVFASLAKFAIANFNRTIPNSRVVKVAYVPKYVTTTQHGMYKTPSKNKAILSKFKIIATARRTKVLRCCFCSSSTNRTDLCARITFPLIFLIFNVVFWIYYLGKR